MEQIVKEIMGAEGRIENALANVRDCESARSLEELRSSVGQAVREAEAGLAVLRSAAERLG